MRTRLLPAPRRRYAGIISDKADKPDSLVALVDATCGLLSSKGPLKTWLSYQGG